MFTTPLVCVWQAGRLSAVLAPEADDDATQHHGRQLLLHIPWVVRHHGWVTSTPSMFARRCEECGRTCTTLVVCFKVEFSDHGKRILSNGLKFEWPLIIQGWCRELQECHICHLFGLSFVKELKFASLVYFVMGWKIISVSFYEVFIWTFWCDFWIT